MARQHVVTRTEVRVDKSGALLTMPKDACLIRQTKHGNFLHPDAYGISKLFAPLLADLNAQHRTFMEQPSTIALVGKSREDWEKHANYLKRINCGQYLQTWKRPYPEPEAHIYDPVECTCQVCGGVFLRHRYTFGWYNVCSDECIRRYKNTKANEWYHRSHPINKGRVARLEQALAGKTCDHCGKPITDARRTTRRYCSNDCNMAAFKERHKPS
jgi:hypothetical protein